ncbi:Lipopolysaccharide kinase Kdo/WaaP family protein [Aspergillus parasiticus SU-1]|uniref:Lipopolysaccharide kinase Kdo/WaaP family protein n=1 Tax=Aspergillus parasiticus (strain ATCC 56775 / NRRL 5862 / SRRC 143 / SU-1) TaxID=1403190 RepID=A0A0F0ILL9_ASPPU|nr:Lipopolysaccharide kinase Kdo/WaaP family protein [Aspergillus parasiticus SU-1]
MAMDRSSYPPTVLSMEVDGEDDSDYRIFIHGRIRYVTIAPGTYDRGTLSMPLDSLPDFPRDESWNHAYISRDNLTGELKTSLTTRMFPGVNSIWHANLVDCLDLTKRRTISPNAFEATCPLTKSGSQTTVIAKLARFEWEIPRIEQETQAYKMLEQTGLAPQFLGHIHEHGRVVGFVLEKLEGRHGGIEDLSVCKALLQRFHGLGLLHGDGNRYNFIIQQGSAKLIDFERSRYCPGEEEPMNAEMNSLRDQLVEDTGRGAGIIFKEIDADGN